MTIPNYEILKVPTFKTERLLIRQAQIEDAKDVCDSIEYSFSSFKKYLHSYAHIRTIEEQSEEYKNLLTKQGHKKEWRFLAYQKETKTLVACLGLHFIDPKVPKFEIGYWCDSRFQGNGYIIEAAKTLNEYAFKALKAKRVQIVCAKKNVKAHSIPLKLGFELEAELKNDQRLPDDSVDSTYIFSKLGV